MGPGAKAGHLAYLGDSEIGAEVNIGAGTITANYDGLGKYKTRIGAGTFIGSNSVIVAPREIGETAYVAAGSVVTEDIQSGDLAVARGRQRNFTGWSMKFWRKGLEQMGADKFPFIRGWLKGRGTSSTNSASED
jgi:bifunctional UDP-N-acetylglucosamine pyrophosphorylase / glucosamine-1-phosphate N-acetyltransferase